MTADQDGTGDASAKERRSTAPLLTTAAFFCLGIGILGYIGAVLLAFASATPSVEQVGGYMEIRISHNPGGSHYYMGASMLLVMVPAFWFSYLLRRRKRYRLIRAAKCPNCRYDMRATPTRCPECGKAPAVDEERSLRRVVFSAILILLVIAVQVYPAFLPDSVIRMRWPVLPSALSAPATRPSAH